MPLFLRSGDFFKPQSLLGFRDEKKIEILA
jgi:hypothetical protein